MIYSLPSAWMGKPDPLRVAVLGAGGTGGEVLNGLMRLHFGLQALGGTGLHVTVFDPAVFREANLGRQRCLPSEVGQNKALALVNRINLAFELDWTAYPQAFDIEWFEQGFPVDLIIGCVDKAAVRLELSDFFHEARSGNPMDWDPMLWLDFGNGRHQGQAILGELLPEYSDFRLPHVVDLFPALRDPEQFDADDTPSCSLAEAIGPGGQDLFINSVLATQGLNLLWQLLTTGQIEQHGVFVDLLGMTSSSLPIDPDTWSFYGYPFEKAA